MGWKQEAIRLASETDLSWRKIAKEIGKPKSTVSDFLREWEKTEEHGPNFLIIDIETSMIKAYVWDIWKQNVRLDAIIEDWYILCFSAKWLGNDHVMNGSNLDFNLENPRAAEKYVLELIWGLLDEADVICAYNGKKFDKKKINAKFLEYGMPEPSPYQIVDPYLIVRGNFSLTSNKMDYVAKLLEQGGKKGTDLKLWIDCMEGSVDALKYMQQYCDQDVTELEDIYLKVRNWDKNHPNMALFYGDEVPRCPTCGSTDLHAEEDSQANTGVSSFSVLRCGNCNKVMRDRISVVPKGKRKNLFMHVR